MATNKDVNINIRTKTDAKGLQKVNKELGKLDKATKSAEKVSKDLRKEADKLGKEQLQAAKAVHKQADEIDRYTKKARVATKESKKVKRANIDLGRSTLLASQGFEDLQFGISGVLNNIPPLVMALGGTAGLAGVISIVAVAASQLGGIFDTTKKEVADLETALDSLKDTTLAQLGDELSNEEDHKAFRDNLEEDGKSLTQFAKGIDAVNKKQQAQRQASIDARKKDIEIQMLQIDNDKTIKTNAEREAAKSPLRQEVAALDDANKIATIRAEIAKLSAVGVESTSRLNRNKRRLSTLSAGRVATSDISREEARADEQSSQRAALVSSLTGDTKIFSPEDFNFENILDLDENTNAQVKNSTAAAKLAEEFRKLLKALDEAQRLPTDSDFNIKVKAESEKIALASIASFQNQAVDTTGKAGGTVADRADILRTFTDISQASSKAKDALNFLEEELTSINRSEGLKQLREEQQKEAATLKSKNDAIRGGSPSIDSGLDILAIQLAAALAEAPKNKQIRDIGDASRLQKAQKLDDTDRLKAKLQAEALVAAEAKARSTQEAAGVDVTSRLGKLKSSASGGNKGLDPFITAAGNGQTGAEAQALKDYLIGRQTELTKSGQATSQTMKILQDLITVSQKQANDAVRTDATLKKMRAQLESLTKNANERP